MQLHFSMNSVSRCNEVTFQVALFMQLEARLHNNIQSIDHDLGNTVIYRDMHIVLLRSLLCYALIPNTKPIIMLIIILNMLIISSILQINIM